MISIIVPVYQAKKSLKRCIDSIITQSYQDLEIILVDDGSTDGSERICDLYAEIDHRVTVIHKENEGVSAARNTGIFHAVGQYVQFVDSDDYLEKNCCELLLQSVDNSKAELAVCGYHHWFYGRDVEKIPEGNETLLTSKMKTEWLTLYEQGYWNMPWNKLYRRDCIKGWFDTSMSLGEDLMFNLEYVSDITRIVFVAKPLYHYLQNENESSLSSKKRQDKIEISLRIRNAMKEFYRERTGEKPPFLIIEERFVKEYLDAIIVLPKDKESNFNEKRENIRQYLKQEELMVSCQAIRLQQIDYRILLWFMKQKQSTILLLLAYFRHWLWKAYLMLPLLRKK